MPYLWLNIAYNTRMDAIKATIDFDSFHKIDLRVGKVTEVALHPNADKLLVLQVDFGELGMRQVCAGIRAFYGKKPTALEWLIGRRFVFCVNLDPRKMRGVESQAMILAASDPRDEQGNHKKLALVEVG